ncbi:hypothetical protein MAPG_12013 [Magnaporthiopsis poae ATCC 64411]|uniref:Uncharacterized protein n=1 Tax=Magnaporthiopsis poae (strain ATCC 64411 / 73-15) TaxID=644358 RepID=A0A0C4EGN5_MAGP6|nr:hypothetical protein MAPG_12013 [Magnaporthiopsis poae ATCC 64411]
MLWGNSLANFQFVGGASGNNRQDQHTRYLTPGGVAADASPFWSMMESTRLASVMVVTAVALTSKAWICSFAAFMLEVLTPSCLRSVRAESSVTTSVYQQAPGAFGGLNGGGGADDLIGSSRKTGRGRWSNVCMGSIILFVCVSRASTTSRYDRHRTSRAGSQVVGHSYFAAIAACICAYACVEDSVKDSNGSDVEGSVGNMAAPPRHVTVRVNINEP